MDRCRRRPKAAKMEVEERQRDVEGMKERGGRWCRGGQYGRKPKAVRMEVEERRRMAKGIEERGGR